jgi:hypothetical protein
VINDEDGAMLASFLRDRNAACPGFGYNLRGLTNDLCPECRQQLVLHVGLSEPKIGLWIAAMIGAASGAGFNIILCGFFAIRAASGGYVHPLFSNVMVPTIGIPSVIFSLALWTLLARGKRIRRARLRTRIHIVILVWSLVIVNLVIFSAVVR